MPRYAMHPGEHLAEQLEALNMSAAGLARQLKVPTNRITHILNGQRAITATSMAAQAGKSLSSGFWSKML